MPISYLKKSSRAVCRVCGCIGAGFHYNGQVCSCCRVFFIRQTKRTSRLICCDNWKCEMRPGAQDNCRLCRYKRCLAANMQPAVVGSQPYTRKGPKREKKPEDVKKERENRRAGARQKAANNHRKGLIVPRPIHPVKNELTGSPHSQPIISPVLTTSYSPFPDLSLAELSPLVFAPVVKEPTNFGQDLLLPIQNIDVNVLLLQHLEALALVQSFNPLTSPTLVNPIFQYNPEIGQQPTN